MAPQSRSYGSRLTGSGAELVRPTVQQPYTTEREGKESLLSVPG